MNRYRLRFIDRPELNRDDFESKTAYRAGETLAVRDGLLEPTLAWAVTAVVRGRQGMPDTLVCDVVPRQHVTLSDGAAAFANERGDRIFIWAEPLGSTAAWLQASAYDPGGDRRYDVRDVRGVQVFVAKDVAPPDIKVRLSLLRDGLVAESPGGSVPGGTAAG